MKTPLDAENPFISEVVKVKGKMAKNEGQVSEGAGSHYQNRRECQSGRKRVFAWGYCRGIKSAWKRCKVKVSHYEGIRVGVEDDHWG